MSIVRGRHPQSARSCSYNHCHRHYLIELANSVRLVEHHENFGPEGWGGVYTGLVRDVHGKNFYRCTDSTR